jgi:hypothetical protein
VSPGAADGILGRYSAEGTANSAVLSDTQPEPQRAARTVRRRSCSIVVASDGRRLMGRDDDSVKCV